MRARWNALPATLVALIVWLAVALGLHLIAETSA
jgi:hypothetical protein